MSGPRKRSGLRRPSKPASGNDRIGRDPSLDRVTSREAVTAASPTGATHLVGNGVARASSTRDDTRAHLHVLLARQRRPPRGSIGRGARRLRRIASTAAEPGRHVLEPRAIAQPCGAERDGIQKALLRGSANLLGRGQIGLRADKLGNLRHPRSVSSAAQPPPETGSGARHPRRAKIGVGAAALWVERKASTSWSGQVHKPTIGECIRARRGAQ